MAVFGAAVFVAPTLSSAQDGAVKIGVLDDMSGPYSDNTGLGDLLALRMAVADFGGNHARQADRGDFG
jgi:branched-chain amino acid transport system substrate-binding protein